MAARYLVLCAISLVALSEAYPQVGKVWNCPGHKNTDIDLKASWTPFALRPNTAYTANASVVVHHDIDAVIESATVWIPQKEEPIYEFPEKSVTCAESGVLQALEMLNDNLKTNITCPIKAGTKVKLDNFKKFIEGSTPVLTGDFRVQAVLKYPSGKEIGCWMADLTIAN